MERIVRKPVFRHYDSYEQPTTPEDPSERRERRDALRHRRFTSMLEPLPAREPYAMNYKPAKIDRNGLFAMNTVFPPAAVSAIRTKYHRAALNFEDLKADLLEYGCDKPSRNVSPNYYAILESVRRDLALPKNSIIPLTTGAVTNNPDFPNSKSPGFPYKAQGIRTKREAVDTPGVLDEIRRIWYDVEAGREVELPDVACYHRAQICTRDRNKIRATWGYPLAVYLAEGAYFYPVLDHLKNLSSSPIAYGVEMANGGMQYVNAAVQHFPNQPMLVGDWSKFDKTIPAWLIRDAFKIIEEGIDFSHVQDSDGKIWPVREERSRKRWRKLVSYFIDTPIRLSDGSRYQKHSGVPSGACFTNIIDSIVNMIVMRYCIYEFTGQLPLFDMYLGDDSIIVLPELIDLGEFSKYAKEQFGMEFSDTKSRITYRPDFVHFLGYYNQNGTPAKSLDTTIASMIYPEHTVRDKLETITRCVGQAYSCFEPYDATAFFLAAKVLAEEEHLSREVVESVIRTHPMRFKYLMTIGVDPESIVFPDVQPNDLCLLTQPGQMRRAYRFRAYDFHDLYTAGVSHFYYEDDDS
nr:RdRp [Wuhan Millipede virus 4]